jgi:hypothetical protein
MTSQWYYGRGSDITGPVSDKELFDLAVCGLVLPSDTVWRDAIEAGVLAGKVKNLFGAGASGVKATVASGVELDPMALEELAPAAAPIHEVQSLAPPTVASPPPARLGRASAGKGAIIVGQDGKNVKYRGKCTTCGREDSSWKSIPIPRGTLRSAFFCTKCRKRRDVEIHGVL